MLARIVFGALVAGTVASPVLAETLNADEARRFVANKMFAFNCFDGTKGVGKILDDGSAQGGVQFSGAGPTRYMRLPSNTLQVRGQQICASIKGIPFEPCFNLDRRDNVSFRGSVSGLGFAYCDFQRHGNGRVHLARAISKPRSLRAPHPTQSADASRTEARPAAVREEPALELRRSTE
ncbi:MAG: hypothetical protein J0G37_16785 [Afipia sp.]|jgi:hypothetical protein|nr:hypothetical protein [Afipia sp.]